jgi:PAS domain S-box-containing protein
MNNISETSVRVFHVDAPAVTEPTAVALTRWDERFSIESASTADEALARIADRPPDCIVAGDSLDGMSGIDLLAAVREQVPDLPVVLFTERPLDAVASEALAAGATDCLRQGGAAEYTLLANRIDHAVRARRAEQNAARQSERVDRPDEADHTEAEGSDDTGEYVMADWAVTKQQKRKADLRRHRDFLRNIQAIADIGGWEVDLRSETLRWTDEIYRIHGLNPGTAVSVDDAIAFYHPEDRETVQEAYRRLTTEGEPYDLECRIVTTADEVRWVRTMGNPWREDGEIVGVHGAFQDITERKQREHELLGKSRALDEAPVGVAITDPTQADNPMVYVNAKFAEITGYTPEETLGRNCRFLQGADTQPETVAALRAEIANEDDVSMELRNYRKDGAAFWNQLEIAPVHDETGELVNYVGFQQDVTERVRRKQALQKRERVLGELHTSTRAFYPSESARDIAAFLVEFIDRAFAFGYVSVKQFDEDSGELTPAAASSGATDSPTALGSVAPGPNPIWQAYQQGESTVFDGEYLPHVAGPADEPVQQALVVPIGDFGVVVAFDTDHSEIDSVDVELIEVAAANAEAAFQQLRSDQRRSEISTELSTHQSTIEALTDSLDALRAIHSQVADSDSEAAIERAVCAGVLDLDTVDFAWIGRPNGRAADIEPTEWAGDGEEYLDSIAADDASRLPAGRAATDRTTVSVSAIAARVLDEPWAKAALSVGYGSAYSVPLVYDDVLYGVLSVYSRREDGFDQLHANLLENVASLAVTYSRILDHRYAEAGGGYVEREFRLGGSTYPLQRLATATGSRIRFDTVAETTDETMRILVTVLEGDSEAVRSKAAASAGVLAAETFGTAGNGQLSLTVKKPFLASVVAKHGGRLVGSVSEPSGTTVRVAAPEQAAKRPLIASLLSRYPEIELLAQRQTTEPDAIETTTAVELLTDRQHEILTAAYHGGYYETPRRVTGEALAESFGISSPTVYNHLQAAHRTLLGAIFELQPNLTAENEGLNT